MLSSLTNLVTVVPQLLLANLLEVPLVPKPNSKLGKHEQRSSPLEDSNVSFRPQQCQDLETLDLVVFTEELRLLLEVGVTEL